MTDAIVLPSGFRLAALETTESTNDDARRLVPDASEDEILVVWSKIQTRGRGRRQREWTSVAGNLYCSFLLRHHAPAARAHELGFVVGVAAAEAIESLVPEGVKVECKWPNDILIDGNKTAGILLETQTTGDEVPWLIAGTGINVANHPKETRIPATSICEAGGSASVEQTLSALAGRFAEWLEIWRANGFDPVREAWEARATGFGQTASVDLGKEKVSGTFAGIDLSGALLLDTADGPRRITAGDVYFAPSGAND